MSANNPKRFEVIIAERMQMPERRGIETGDTKCHARNLARAHALRWPETDVVLDCAMRLNQITAAARDLDQSIAFYQALGLKLIVKSPHYARFELPRGEATFSLHVVEGDIPRENAPQLYFECLDVDFEVQRLAHAGVTIERAPMMQSWLWYEAWLRDPAGNQICLYNAGDNRRFPPWRTEDQKLPENLHLVIRDGAHWSIARMADGAEQWRALQARYADYKSSLGPFDLYSLLAVLERDWPELFVKHEDAIRAFAASDAPDIQF
jgi:catechol 2,3-dioxygenase-like lactoylglutathione lyase family enzyme